MTTPLLQRLVLATASLALVALLGWSAWTLLRPLPTLDEIDDLAQLGRTDEAIERVQSYVRSFPDHSEGRFRLAVLLIDRDEAAEQVDEASAETALELLEPLQFENPRRMALALLYQGKALDRLLRHDEAESVWKQALERDPQVPEAGWLLLQHYHRQRRIAEARELSLRLHHVEPNPVDRVRLLVELIRLDVHRLAPRGVIQWFDPVVERHPEDLRSRVTLGVALTREGLADRGLSVLREALQDHPEDPLAWEGYLQGLEQAAQLAALVPTLDRLPAPLADDPRFARFRGLAAVERQDFEAAAHAYQEALAVDPDDPELIFQLARVLPMAGQPEEAEQYQQRHQDYEEARGELRRLYAVEVEPMARTPAILNRPDLYRQIAELRERMGLRAEALAWHRLVLESRPEDPTSLAAIERLAGSPGS
ncbi:hypothetical protein BH23PLA1_BH23PLA1_07590 [soil metagenome]